MKLEAQGGEIYAHLFENLQAAIPRGLYWNIRVEFARVKIAGEHWEPSFACEWLVWPVRRLRELDGMTIGHAARPDLVASSVYLFGNHNPVAVERLAISRSQSGAWSLDAKFAADIRYEGRRLRGVFGLQCQLAFGGIIVVPDNIAPRPSGPDGAAAMLEPFISLEELEPPRLDRFRYVLSEKGS